jgi:hypothetical protein
VGLLLAGLGITLAGQQSSGQGVWDRANDSVVRLPPDAFPRVSSLVRRELQRRGCTIPQSYRAGKPHNLISGEFIRRGQIDIAALCSRSRESSILIFQNGSPSSVDELSRRADADYLQELDDRGTIGFSRVIHLADASHVREHARDNLHLKLPVLNHGAIEDEFLGKASETWCWNEGRWYRLSGTND